MSTQIVLPQGTYPTGIRSFGPVAIPSGVSSFQLTLDGTQMTNSALSVEINLDLSIDGGATYASSNPSQQTNPFPMRCVMGGGAKDSGGTQLATYSVGSKIPNPNSVARSIKGSVNVTGASLTTQGSLVLT